MSKYKEAKQKLGRGDKIKFTSVRSLTKSSVKQWNSETVVKTGFHAKTVHRAAGDAFPLSLYLPASSQPWHLLEIILTFTATALQPLICWAERTVDGLTPLWAKTCKAGSLLSSSGAEKKPLLEQSLIRSFSNRSHPRKIFIIALQDPEFSALTPVKISLCTFNCLLWDWDLI